MKATPVITWSNPANITYGTALNGAQLNATANVPGAFVYTPAAGAILNAGNAQTLHAAFTPTDAANYNSASKDVTINVLAGQQLTFLGPAEIWVSVGNNSNAGRHIDVRIDIYKNGTLVGQGQVVDTAVSGSGLGNSTKYTVDLALVGSAATFQSGDRLQSAVFVRRTSGADFAVKMWYNHGNEGNSQGWSRFSATIGGASAYYYYLNTSLLGGTPGGSVESVTLTATGAYQSLGAWSVTVP